MTEAWRELHNFARFTKYYLKDQSTENEVGGVCVTYGGDEQCVHNFVWNE
jgi:hypothetical protein